MKIFHVNNLEISVGGPYPQGNFPVVSEHSAQFLFHDAHLFNHHSYFVCAHHGRPLNASTLLSSPCCVGPTSFYSTFCFEFSLWICLKTSTNNLTTGRCYPVLRFPPPNKLPLNSYLLRFSGHRRIDPVTFCARRQHKWLLDWFLIESCFCLKP